MSTAMSHPLQVETRTDFDGDGDAVCDTAHLGVEVL